MEKLPSVQRAQFKQFLFVMGIRDFPSQLFLYTQFVPKFCIE